MNIRFTNPYAQVPPRGSEYAAGYDLYAAVAEDVTIWPHETVKVTTGLAMELPKNTFGAIFARSGLATKQGLRPANCVGVIDEDYRGEVIVAVHNDTNDVQTIQAGDRIAQLVIIPYLTVDFVEAELDDTARGSDGFGSSGR